MKSLLVAGTHSGCGKTTITLSILSALKRLGYKVQAFKTGPDFIDTGLHSLITQRHSQNLDVWMCGEHYVQSRFSYYCKEADIAVIESAMGLYDGQYSPAYVAKLLNVGVILVIDARGMAESVGAVVHGFKTWHLKDPSLFKGVILNKISSQRHLNRILNALKGITCFGYMPIDKAIEIPHRHLGLFTAEENPLSQSTITRLADIALQFINFDDLFKSIDNTDISSSSTDSTLMSFIPLPFNACHSNAKVQIDLVMSNLGQVSVTHCTPLEDVASLQQDFMPLNPVDTEDIGAFKPFYKCFCKARVAVAYDRAFCFYYQDNLEMLEKMGYKLIFFSPLKDTCLPQDIDAIYIGGGYPEIYAKELSENFAMIDAIKKWAEDYGYIYAECGGLMYLGQKIIDFEGREFDTVGVFAFKTIMNKGKTHLGYREVILCDDCVIGKKGAILRGHEFHYSEIMLMSEDIKNIYNCKDNYGQSIHTGGYLYKNSLASYVHLHFARTYKIE